jgi:hypothetical protein
VDHPDDLVPLDPPLSGARKNVAGISARVLVVGDGDFSFSAALARSGEAVQVDPIKPTFKPPGIQVQTAWNSALETNI